MSYRPIDISREKPRATADLPAPMLDWLPISRLVIDDRYQRQLAGANWVAIRKIADSFHWSRFTPVLVAPIENGLFALIDGQHRTHAAALCGFESVPAMAVHMTNREQARAFGWVNGQVVRISPHQIYRAALAAGEDWALKCDAAVSDAGCKLMTYNASASLKKAGEIYSVGTIRAAVLAGNAAVVTAALAGLRTYDSTGRVALWTDYVIRPLIKAMARKSEYRRVDLAAILQGADPFRVIEAATRAGNPAADAFAMLLERAARGRAA